MSKESVFLVVTSAFVLAGDIAKPGEIVEVSDSEARDFLRRGMARVATEADGVPNAEPEPEAEAEAEAEAEPEPEAEQEEEQPAAAEKPAAKSKK